VLVGCAKQDRDELEIVAQSSNHRQSLQAVFRYKEFSKVVDIAERVAPVRDGASLIIALECDESQVQ
jgi:hypothetical protein